MTGRANGRPWLLGILVLAAWAAGGCASSLARHGPAAPETRREGRDEEAEASYLAAIAAAERAGSGSRAGQSLVTSLQDLAALRVRQGRYPEAEALYERALAVTERSLARLAWDGARPMAPRADQARLLEPFALLQLEQGKPAEARRLLVRKLALLYEVRHRDGGASVSPLVGLAVAALEMGRLEEAEQALQRVTIATEGHGDFRLPAPAIWAELRVRQKRDRDAEKLYREALARSTPDAPVAVRAALAHRGLGRLLARQGRLGEAEVELRQALALEERRNGPAHPRVAAALDDLAEVERLRGHEAEAEMVLRRGLAIRERLGPDHPLVAISLDRLARLLEEAGREAEARNLQMRAAALRRKE
jgi:tetratricopeptide (TPR) repeat protein